MILRRVCVRCVCEGGMLHVCMCVHMCLHYGGQSQSFITPYLNFQRSLTEPGPAHWIVMENPPASASYTRITGTVATPGSYMDFIN